MSHPGAAVALIVAGLLMRLSYLALRGSDRPEPKELPPQIPPPTAERLSADRTVFVHPRGFFEGTLPPGDAPLTAERVRAAARLAARGLPEHDPNGPPLWGDGLD